MARDFPVLKGYFGAPGGGTVPWDFVAPHSQQAMTNHYQTLERLAERGGLSWSEIECVVCNKEWDGVAFTLPRERDRYVAFEAGAKVRVEKLLDAWREKILDECEREERAAGMYEWFDEE